MKLNFVFWGTPDIAAETLEILKNNGYIPCLIITAPDKPQGRKMIITPPSVKIWAQKNNIPFLQPEKLDEEFISKVLGKSDLSGNPGSLTYPKTFSKFDLFIVVAYGKIIPEKIINLPKFGSINIHYSLLPKYRGASPVESAILNGDTETGISIQKMEFKMDAGPIIAQEKINILPDEKSPELYKKLIPAGAELLVKVLPQLVQRSDLENSKRSDLGTNSLTPQNESLATFCKKIKKEDGLVDLEKDSPSILYNKFRAYAEWPRIYFFEKKLPAGHNRIIITDVFFQGQTLGIQKGLTLEKKQSPSVVPQFIIKKVIPEGKKEITWQEFQRNIL
ncbi:MAG: methionyl-tRNA formyltransferase [Patescibacteria group bacterium]